MYEPQFKIMHTCKEACARMVLDSLHPICASAIFLALRRTEILFKAEDGFPKGPPGMEPASGAAAAECPQQTDAKAMKTGRFRRIGQEKGDLLCFQALTLYR
jgi:hypothetical protein